MPTKIRSSKRQIKLPVKFHDHVMENSSQRDELIRSNVIDTELGTDKVGDRGLFKEGRISESEELFDNDESNGGKESKEENIEEIDTEESIDKEYQKEMHKSLLE
ncbi:hypothetical protein Tco_0231770 [Tanacetum coccineum]